MPGLGKKTFTAGDVLIAGDVNNFLMDQTVMVFANAAARTAAIPTPSKGMTTYRSDIDGIESFNGTAFVGLPGLELIKTQTIGTAVTSVTVTGAFSATYDNYKIVMSGGSGSVNSYLSLRFGASATQYFDSMILKPYAGALSSASNINTDAFQYAGGVFVAQNAYMNIDLLSPNAAKFTQVATPFTYQPNLGQGVYGGVHQVATAYTDFTIGVVTGNITGGLISVYGYRKAI